MIKFSAETKGFYDTEINIEIIPFDAIEISAELYRAVLAAQSGGKTITADQDGFPVAIDPQPYTNTVPMSVTPKQARLALLGAGLLATVEGAIASLPGIEGDAARVTWEFANEFKRNDPLLLQIAGVLELDDEQIDQLFTTAATL